METSEAPQSTCGSPKPKRARIEVFSAMLEKDVSQTFVQYSYDRLFGTVLLRSCNHNFPIFDSSTREPPQISPEGHIPLTSLEHSIPVEDKAFILPWFVDLVRCSMDQTEHALWKADVDGLDQLVCRTIHCFHQLDLHVNFAVYCDPVEAHLDVYYIDLEYGEQDAPIQVQGTVTASNSFLLDSEAKSTLFHSGGGVISLKAGKSVPLTLSRRITVVPHRSTLIVHVSLQVRMGQFDLSFEEKVKFNSSSRNGAEEFFIRPDCANCSKLLVKITWLECEDRLE